MTNEIVLIGDRSRIYKCDECGNTRLSQRTPRRCPSCDKHTIFIFIGEVGDGDKVFGHVCPACHTVFQIVEDGGVYWECKKCKTFGVVAPDAPLALETRKKLNTYAPAFAGIYLEGCPQCAIPTDLPTDTP